MVALPAWAQTATPPPACLGTPNPDGTCFAAQGAPQYPTNSGPAYLTAQPGDGDENASLAHTPPCPTANPDAAPTSLDTAAAQTDPSQACH